MQKSGLHVSDGKPNTSHSSNMVQYFALPMMYHLKLWISFCLFQCMQSVSFIQVPMDICSFIKKYVLALCWWSPRHEILGQENLCRGDDHEYHPSLHLVSVICGGLLDIHQHRSCVETDNQHCPSAGFLCGTLGPVDCSWHPWHGVH